MTLAISRSVNRDAPASDAADADDRPMVKTSLDCDILTIAHSARAYAGATAFVPSDDPLRALYKPLGNRDVACFLAGKAR